MGRDGSDDDYGEDSKQYKCCANSSKVRGKVETPQEEKPTLDTRVRIFGLKEKP